MLIPKSGAVAQNIDGTLANFENIVESLPFFDNVIAENSEGLEHIEELPDYKRADFWEDEVSVKRKNGSFVLSIEVKDKDAVLAEDLAWRVSQTFSHTVSLYYNIRTELDARIIEGPVTSIGTGQNKLYLLIWSVILGFSAIYFSFYISDKISGRIFESGEVYPEREFSLAGLSQKFPKDKFEFESKRPEFIPKEETPVVEKEIKDQETYVFPVSQPEVVTGRKAAAPDNLPIAPDNLPVVGENISKEYSLTESPERDFGKLRASDSSSRDSDMDKKEKEKIIKEATPEEVKKRLEKLQGKKDVIFNTPSAEEAKERLNRLLSGKF
ncbi:MAG: hypothetical protein QG620_99 [Patescibacteria group bacterium]|nr:hypothetical protein [Patescibacteria group bacterium]